MKPKGVWLSGLCSLALVCAGGLYLTLPQIEHHVQARVDATLKAQGLKDVKATVSGQDVTLAATTNSPAAAAHLAQARDSILNMREALIHEGRLPHGMWPQQDLPGGQAVNGVVTEVGVNAPTPDSATALAQIPAWPASGSGSASVGVLASATGAPAAGPPEVSGEKATTIASSSAGTPPVAGDSARPASDTVGLTEAQACQDQLNEALGSRRLDFVPGTYQLAPGAQAVLDDAYRAIETCPQNLKITVAAYTDNVGDPTAKQIISRTRAQVAADALVKRGLAAGRVDARGYGEASPIADNATPQGRLLNQRVAISVRAE